MISAWDRITEKVSPSQWMTSRLPLLSQYLTANAESFSIRCFGVSAQGGDLSQAVALRKVSQPAERIAVVDDDLDSTHDITLPVQWALGLEGEHG